MLPEVSTARAANLWLPLVTVREFQLYVIELSTTDPTVVPSTRKSTWSTATLSEALAESWTWPDTVVPLEGAVSETEGGVVSVVVPELSTIERSSTVREPLPPLVRPKLSAVTLLGMGGVSQLACDQPLDDGKFGLVCQYENAYWVSRANTVKKTGTFEVYQLLMRYWWPGVTEGEQAPRSCKTISLLSPLL